VRVGVISDTHGLLRPEAVAALRGVKHILHAGDVGDPAILDALRELAPVTAIRGNIDREGPCALLPATEFVSVAGANLYLVHNIADLELNPEAAGVAAVIYGHSHKSAVERRRGVLFFNPGAAGPRRFALPVTVGLLEIGAGGVEATVVPLL
jgi:uncharacterized protein